jgi:pimeloyl-ACP methyl ester carboxylesterase
MTTVFKSPAGEKAIMDLYNGLMDRWPVPYESRIVSTRHGDTHMIVSGDPAAPPLILLHGASSNATMWIGDVPQYSACFRVYAVDMIGEAGKSAPTRPDKAGYVEWLDDVLTALQLDRVTLVGISQGGGVAVHFAAAHPERVTQIALIAPAGVTTDKLSFIFKMIPNMLLGEWGMQRSMRQLYADQPIPDGVVDVMHTIMHNYKPNFGQPFKPLTDDDLRRLTMPVFLIGGDKDVIRDNRKIAARLRSGVPQVQVTIVPGGGHALNDTIGPILAFLTKTPQVNPLLMA